ncbi:MAG: CPBP family intramembrane glutamic endopeptidase [Candidatus Neomarinimicrobiota bacterium]|jgi:membrane protease YdiL (CAAX protease family)|nr:CPBP family intramembrane metalloprotease [Candidatus Neomarinimicrobiota bacterium]MDD3966212.1 CPBP family intramembrane metalloprotease [Candidatus Neomarinimicrobiota bacterium]MDX9779774.1 CPBP family intramembrane glutamic endopeptidase [bacterium]
MKESGEKHFAREVDPKHLWNASGIIQQLLLILIMGIAYFFVRMRISANPGEYPGFENWLQSLHNLFRFPSPPAFLLRAVLIGVGSALLLLGLDTLAGFIRKKALSTWIHRSDCFLPLNREQRNWAIAITLLGSFVEELLFRGFIFSAMLPVWNSWIWAALILSAVFSFLHAALQGFWASLWIFLISVLLCGFVVWGFSIYELALIHISINLMNLFVIPFLFAKTGDGRR